MNHSEYMSMFKMLATDNADIEHHDATHPAFARIIKSTGDPFEDKLYLEEFINKNQKNLKYPALCVFSYNHQYQGDDDMPLNKIFNGAFSVLQKGETLRKTASDAFDSLQTSCDTAERIAEDILTNLATALRDKGCSVINIDSVFGEKSGPDINNIVAQTIYFSFTQRTSITL